MTGRSPLLQLVALLTVMGFFPASVGAWNFIEAEGAEAKPVSVQVEAPQEQVLDLATKPSLSEQRVREPQVRLLSEEELKTTASGPEEPIVLASASLPSAEELLASITSAAQAATPGTQGSELRGPAGPPQAVTDLANADALYGAGNYGGAAEAYVDLIDMYPGTHEALMADEGLIEIAKGAANGTIPQEALATFEANLLNWQDRSVEGKYVCMDYLCMRAFNAGELGNKQEELAYYASARNAAWALIQEHPNHFLQESVTDYYAEAVAVLGREALDEALENLEDLTMTVGPCMARFGAYAQLAEMGWYQQHDRGKYVVNCVNLLNEVEHGYVDAALADPNTYYWAKGAIGLRLGEACIVLERYEQARDVLEASLEYSGANLEYGGLTRTFVAFRLAQAKDVGADVLVTSCPYCISNFEESRIGLGDEERLQVKDLTEVVLQALEAGEEPR